MVTMLFSLGLCTKKTELRLETGTGSSATGSVILGKLAVNRYIFPTSVAFAFENCNAFHTFKVPRFPVPPFSIPRFQRPRGC